jgi:hypothetical protein
MKLKWVLFLGILLLTTGIILRMFTEMRFVAILLIILGVLLKTIYIISKARSGEYKPGYELIFLFIGLCLFFSGLYFRTHKPAYPFVFLMVSGLILKTAYIILFIVKVRALGKMNRSGNK